MNDMPEENKTDKKSPDIGMWIVYGLMAGTLIGVVTDNLALWMGIGTSLGILIGAISSMDRG